MERQREEKGSRGKGGEVGWRGSGGGRGEEVKEVMAVITSGAITLLLHSVNHACIQMKYGNQVSMGGGNTARGVQ